MQGRKLTDTYHTRVIILHDVDVLNLVPKKTMFLKTIRNGIYYEVKYQVITLPEFKL